MSRIFYLIGLIVSGLAFLYWFDCENLDACEGFGLFAQHAGTDVDTSPPPPLITTNRPAFMVKDGNKQVVSLKDHFRFSKSDIRPLSSPTQLQKAVADMKTYIQQNPNRQLEVVGYYNNQEKNPSNSIFANLGLARADQLKQLLVNAGIPAHLIVPIARKDDLLKLEQDTVYGGIEAKYQVRSMASLNIVDADNIVAISANNLWFLNPKTENNNVKDFDKEFQQIADYLKKNPNREVTISGNYRDDATKNLGEARAAIIQKRLESMGIPSSKIEVGAKKDPYLHASNDTVYSPIAFLFKVSEATAKDLLAKKRPLRFNSNSADLLLSKELQKYLNDVKTYLLQDTNKNVLLTGHTDSDGKDTANQTLGKKRAEDVKVRLVNMGIAVDRISTSSKGEKEPIATNNTSAGKAQNRRVEISVQ
ncbi:MAG: OmpA family protein [Chitinophagales bacterium]